VNYTAEADSPLTTFLQKGGLKIEGRCANDGDAQLYLAADAEDGAISVSESDGNVDNFGTIITDWDVSLGSFYPVFTESSFPDDRKVVTFRYLGADGTNITGNLQVMRDAAIAQCVISGTLLLSEARPEARRTRRAPSGRPPSSGGSCDATSIPVAPPG
jgi:hypothetical protein